MDPLAQIIFAIALLAVGYIPLRMFFGMLRGGGFLHMYAYVIPVPVLGAWLLVTALRRGNFLDVQLSSGRKRFTFNRQSDADGRQRMLKSIGAQWCVEVSDSPHPIDWSRS